MKTYKIFLINTVIISMISCKMEMNICTGLSSSKPIEVKKKELQQSIGIGGDYNVFFNPLFLPIKIVYNSKTGFSVIDEGEVAAITPIGTVGIEYTIGSKEEKTINGHKITGGDFVVGLRDRNKKETTLYKIEGYNRLKVVTTGRTQIDAQAGYVEIDITDAKVQELVFIDISKISIVNNTDEPQTFKLSIKDMTSSEIDYVCEVDPHSYKYFPRFDLSKSINSSFDAEYFIKVESVDERNNLTTTLSRKVDFGDACHINEDESGLSLTLRENLNKN
ncbi:MAG: hypothetical protein SFU99_14250 [Saprospiraceae bacterium]|nr:hypothetical protein [Saprospiraceae bacterium]